MGTGTALVAAYVLDGELARADGDHRAAFARYERRIRPYAEGCQKGGDRTGPFLAPRTATGLWLRNTLLSRPFLLDRMLRAGQKVSSTVELPDYGADLPECSADSPDGSAGLPGPEPAPNGPEGLRPRGDSPAVTVAQRRDSGIASPHGASLRP
ncbi:hypothetical protein ABZ840_22375 [Streptomyces sp. NPDC047117]|uniref:hypothetical protein n=1 Tax=Streptomyces sp. NPDC047117 TaxID=3155379 RepID=UPI00340FE44A